MTSFPASSERKQYRARCVISQTWSDSCARLVIPGGSALDRMPAAIGYLSNSQPPGDVGEVRDEKAAPASSSTMPYRNRRVDFPSLPSRHVRVRDCFAPPRGVLFSRRLRRPYERNDKPHHGKDDRR